MGSWILILTLIRYQGVAVTQVGGFDTQKACMTAATGWIKDTDKDSSTSRYAICVSKT